MPLLTSFGSAKGLGFGALAAGDSGDLVLVQPASISYTGTSAAIGTNGTIEFTGITSLSINNCFTTDYENYLVRTELKYLAVNASSNATVYMRNAGVDQTSASGYREWVYYSSGGRGAFRQNDAGTTVMPYRGNTPKQVYYGTVWTPKLTKPTFWKNRCASSFSSGALMEYNDISGTNGSGTSVDGFTIKGISTGITGRCSIYGYRG